MMFALFSRWHIFMHLVKSAASFLFFALGRSLGAFLALLRSSWLLQALYLICSPIELDNVFLLEGLPAQSTERILHLQSRAK